MKYTILGAGGSVSDALIPELQKRKIDIRLVSRRAAPVAGITDNISADLLDAKAVSDAVAGSNVAFLLVGLPYATKIWQEKWPIVMQNAIDACAQHKVKLIFFDNVYMYGRVTGKMTEETSDNPCSKKGEVRAKIAKMFMRATKTGKIKGLIARAADFYGPNTPLSMFTNLAIDNIKKGKKPEALLHDDTTHSFTFIPDTARALADLAADESAVNQVWHLPTYNPAYTGKEMIETFTKYYGVSPKYSIMGKMTVNIGSLFIPIVREIKEMLYQYENSYYFDSTKFEKHFGYGATNYEEGLKQTAEWYKE